MNIKNEVKKIENKLEKEYFEIFTGDKFADLIMTAATQKDNINKILKQRSSKHRIREIDIGTGIPPEITFGITELTDEEIQNEE